MSVDAVGWFCEHLVEMRRRAQRHGFSAEFETLRSAAAAGDDLDDSAVQELSRKLGGPEFRVRTVTLPGVGDGRPAQVSYRCPANRCTRSGTRAPGGPHPVCQLTGARLTLTAEPS